MSRFTHSIFKDNKIYVVAYGWDKNIDEYFIQVFDPTTQISEAPIVDQGTFISKTENPEMFDLYKEWGVPDNISKKVLLNEKF